MKLFLILYEYINLDPTPQRTVGYNIYVSVTRTKLYIEAPSLRTALAITEEKVISGAQILGIKELGILTK